MTYNKSGKFQSLITDHKLLNIAISCMVQNSDCMSEGCDSQRACKERGSDGWTERLVEAVPCVSDNYTRLPNTYNKQQHTELWKT